MRKRWMLPAGTVLFLLAGLVLYFTVYQEIRSEAEDASRLNDRKMKALLHQEQLILDREAIEREAAALREWKKREEGRLFEGQTAALAGAALQNRVKEILAGAGGTISSQRSEKPEVAGAFQVVTVSVDADLPDAKALSDTLYALETHAPRLVVREVDVMTKNFRDPRELAVKLRISALTRGK